MRSAFLLRFQEPCVSSDTNTANCGTETKTKKPREDAKDAGFHTIAALRKGNGTGTTTRIARETADTLGNHSVFARKEASSPVTGTKTSTAVRAEMADSDPGQFAQRVFPLTSPSLSTCTETKTAVKK